MMIYRQQKATDDGSSRWDTAAGDDDLAHPRSVLRLCDISSLVPFFQCPASVAFYVSSQLRPAQRCPFVCSVGRAMLVLR